LSTVVDYADVVQNMTRVVR